MDTDSIIQEIKTFFGDLAANIIHLLPRLILSLFVLLIGWLIARLVQTLIKKLILYLNRNVNEQLKTRLIKIDLESSASFIAKTFFWIILVFAIAVDTQILGLNFLAEWFRGLILYLPNILAAIVIIFIGLITGKLVQDLVVSAASRTGITNGQILGKLLRYTIILITIIIAIDQIGIDVIFLTNVLIIILAALLFGAALAFGLGAKTSISNILGSYYVQKSYKEGDTIKLKETEGVIVKITPTTVIVETKSGQVTIPAKDFNEKESVLLK